MNLIDLLNASLRGRAGKTALRAHPPPDQPRDIGREYRFGDLDDLSDRLASFLAGRGVAKGDRVCVFAPNSPWIAVLLLATWKLGAIYVPINILYRKREVAHVLADAEPKALVVDPSVRRFTSEALAGSRSEPLTLLHPRDLADAAASAVGPLSPSAVDGGDPAGIFYTSGTTGRAKGAILTHDNLAFNAITLHAAWQWRESDQLLLCLPLAHLHGLANGLLGAMLAGAQTVLLDRFAAARVIDLIEEGQATVFFGVPTIYARLVAPELDLGARDLSGVRLFVSGSAPLPAELQERFHALTGHAVLERYGLTEALMVASNPYAGRRKPGSVGLPLPAVAVRVVTGSGEDAAASEEGELWVKGPNVFSGYWRNPQATGEALSGGWLKTGDIARRSAEGYLTICGRTKELIISGGFNVYPREVEEVIEAAPGVLEAAVAGIPHSMRGEVPKGFVVPRAGHTLSWPALEDHCRRHLADFKVPRVWEEVAELPRNALGKILRQALTRHPRR